MQDLKTLAKAIKSFPNDDGQAERLLLELYEEGYAKGYRVGRVDEKKITRRLRYRYNVLLGWLEEQLDKFSGYTTRFEYKMIMKDITAVKDEYMLDNRLGSCYKPKRSKVGEDDVDFKTSLASYLPDVIGEFQAKEQARLEASKNKPLDLKTSMFE